MTRRTLPRTPQWWGSNRHRLYTLGVFMVLASLDNSARTVFPPLYAVLGEVFDIGEARLGLVTASTILVSAMVAVGWGFGADRLAQPGARKRLLLIGTLVWSAATLGTGFSTTYSALLVSRLIAALGIGCISSVGFSVVTDFVPAGRRGVMLGLWALLQSVGGGGGGALLGSTLGAYDWRAPFWIIACLGLFFALLYLFAYEPPRGATEPLLARELAAGRAYGRTARLRDLPVILRRPTNRWLLLQDAFATAAFGAQVWMPRLFIARVQAGGYDLSTATISGNFLSLLCEMGVYASLLAGWFGDRWQRRNRSARSWIATVSRLSTVPFMVAFFLLPIRDLMLPVGEGALPIIWATITSIFTNSSVLSVVLLAFVGHVLLFADGPNRAALYTEVNPPEHRATVIGISALVGGISAAIGNAAAGVLFTWLAQHIASPLNYAVGLALAQLCFLPAAYCCWRTVRTAAADIDAVDEHLRRFANASPADSLTDSAAPVRYATGVTDKQE